MSDDIRHESFGCIGAYHVSGNARLFMSPHKHQHFVTVRITEASVRRDLSTDWIHGDRKIIAEVHLSEAQWTHFVSSPNMASGSPCTISCHRDGPLKECEPPPESAGSRETFSKELKEHAEKALAGAREAIVAMGQLLEGGSISKTALREVMRNLSMALNNSADGGMGFVLKQSEEWLDKMVESAKTEIEAHAMAGLRGIALAAIASEIDGDTKTKLIEQIKQAAE